MKEVDRWLDQWGAEYVQIRTDTIRTMTIVLLNAEQATENHFRGQTFFYSRPLTVPLINSQNE